MIAFKKMWEDVSSILTNSEIENINIINKFQTGFVVDEDGDVKFITKDDFVDFWCRIQCLNQITMKQVAEDKKSNMKYVYEIVRRLPYISEKSGILKISE